MSSRKAPPRSDPRVFFSTLPVSFTSWLGSSLSPCTGARNEQVVGLRLTDASIALLLLRNFRSQRLPPPDLIISLYSARLEKLLS